FKLVDKYSNAIGAGFTDESGASVPLLMGCYGIGMSRTLAAVIESSHDADGIVWPASIAPFEVVVIVAAAQDEAQRTAGEALYSALRARGIDAAYDDRDERPGVKFKDADLVGYPVRVVVGKGLAQGEVEVRLRRDPASTRAIPVDDAPEAIADMVARLKAEIRSE
ncbi:MAG: His/Gly/Thr/Pro-type tRNA ligase C-terminal domain-containing protein, partial [Armatimonadota bacterium]